LFGSLVGGVSTFVAHWVTQHVQLRAQSLMKRHAEREALYADIVEASKRFADVWSHHAESPEVVANLYSAIERMRLTSSDPVIVAAEGVMHEILDAYAQPDKSFDDLRQRPAKMNCALSPNDQVARSPTNRAFFPLVVPMLNGDRESVPVDEDNGSASIRSASFLRPAQAGEVTLGTSRACYS
jgi:hypothetical protein